MDDGAKSMTEIAAFSGVLLSGRAVSEQRSCLDHCQRTEHSFCQPFDSSMGCFEEVEERATSTSFAINSHRRSRRKAEGKLVLNDVGRAEANIVHHSSPNVSFHCKAVLQESDSCRLSLCSLSCAAVRGAVLALYRMDDFDLQPLGEGFFSHVYRAQHRVTDEVMVLKLNKPNNNRSNVLREVELMRKLQHPNVLRFRGACVDSGQLHALTEFCNMGGLDCLISGDEWNQLAWSVRVGVALDVGQGMEYIHESGYMHRDLTSKNILCKRDEGGLTAVVGDLGLACPLPKDSSVKLPVAGTPYWMAPECLNEEFYCGMADVFSFGIILCEMIARIDADPDVMPRTATFGLDYIRYSELCPKDAPLDFVKLAFRCCLMDPNARPKFVRIVPELVSLLKALLRQEEGDVVPVSLSMNNSGSSSASGKPKICRKYSVLSLDAMTGRMKQRNSISRSAVVSVPIVNGGDAVEAEEEPQEQQASIALARCIAAVDPFYQPMPPQSANPFLAHKRFADGQKIYTESFFVNRKAVAVAAAASVPRRSDMFTIDTSVENDEEEVVPDSCGSSALGIRRCHSLPSSASNTLCALYPLDDVNANCSVDEEKLGSCTSCLMFLETRRSVPQQFLEEDRQFVEAKVCRQPEGKKEAAECSSSSVAIVVTSSRSDSATKDDNDIVPIDSMQCCSYGNTLVLPNGKMKRAETIDDDDDDDQEDEEKGAFSAQCCLMGMLSTENGGIGYEGSSAAATAGSSYLGSAKPIIKAFLCYGERGVVPERKPNWSVSSSRRCTLL